MTAILNFLEQTGFYQFAQDGNWKCLIMMGISFVLMYLAIVKKFEPLLLLPIAFGMLMTNLPGAEMFHEILFAGGHVHWDLFGGAPITAEFVNGLEGITDTLRASFTSLIGTSVTPGLVDYLYLGVKLGIYPCLIFLGVGCMTDFGPLIANPKSLLLGAAAQLGIFMTYVGCRLSGMFTAAAGLLHRHHRRRRRPHRHLRDHPSGPRAAGPHRRGCLLLHGAGSRDPAPHHETADHQGRASDRHEAAASGQPQTRRSSSPSSSPSLSPCWCPLRLRWWPA